MTLLPLVAVNVPSGHIPAHPRLIHDWQGNTLSHRSLLLRHSAQDKADFLEEVVDSFGLLV